MLAGGFDERLSENVHYFDELETKVAAGGMSIGWKGMQNAAKILALTAIDLYEQPALIEQARSEWEGRKPDGFEYRALLGDRDPPLDYRD